MVHFSGVMSIAISAKTILSGHLYRQLFAMSYLRYLCLFSHSGVFVLCSCFFCVFFWFLSCCVP